MKIKTNPAWTDDEVQEFRASVKANEATAPVVSPRRLKLNVCAKSSANKIPVSATADCIIRSD